MDLRFAKWTVRRYFASVKYTTDMIQNGKQGEVKNLGEANAAIAVENAEKQKMRASTL